MKPLKISAPSGAPAARRARAVESFTNAADTIGAVEPGMSLFCVTRGQFSMIDAVLHVLAEVGPAKISLWTWTVAEYEVQTLTRLRTDRNITGGRLVIDAGAKSKNAGIIAEWQESFGPDSVRYVINHAKIATVQTESLKILLRGSMNLNFNPRFEQLDITEGGEDFDLVRRIEDELPAVETWAGARRASKLADAFTPEQLSMFTGVKTWKPTPK